MAEKKPAKASTPPPAKKPILPEQPVDLHVLRVRELRAAFELEAGLLEKEADEIFAQLRTKLVKSISSLRNAFDHSGGRLTKPEDPELHRLADTLDEVTSRIAAFREDQRHSFKALAKLARNLDKQRRRHGA